MPRILANDSSPSSGAPDPCRIEITWITGTPLAADESAALAVRKIAKSDFAVVIQRSISDALLIRHQLAIFKFERSEMADVV